MGNGGLSPRVRGNPYLPAQPADGLRSIPACAGKPTAGELSPNPMTVYPPRVRGNRAARRLGDTGGGSIPACAGKPFVQAAGNNLDEVYPRVCGETSNPSTSDLYPQGLSPRVRGNQPKMMMKAPMRGSIPACAGKPSVTSPVSTRNGVYPRVCGENPTQNARYSSTLGSIPACAGKPRFGVLILMWMTVYPRVCGETMTATKPSTDHCGLSPRVRGNHPHMPVFVGKNRSIPACAGKPDLA